MPQTLFQYPGGKSGEFKRIESLIPDHECFVEGFGGSGVITLNKEPAEVDVYNDLDSELVHFFIVYREAPERLIDWLQRVPYSYDVYEDFVDAFYGKANEERDGRLPGEPLTNNLVTSDDIQEEHIIRAGVFFSLRYMQFGAKYQGRSGFGRSKVQNGAKTFKNAKDRLEEFIGCWDHVTIENVSYEKLIDTYDSEDTLFYFDPPYIGTEGYYRESGFSHSKFCDNLERIEGYWMVSYDQIPKQLEKYYISVEDATNFIDSGMKGEGKDTIETIVMNYNPDEVRKFTSSGQVGFESIDFDGDSKDGPSDDGDGVKLFSDQNEDDDDSITLFD